MASMYVWPVWHSIVELRPGIISPVVSYRLIIIYYIASLSCLLKFIMETIARDEPLTPAGRLFLRPETEQVINCIIGGKNPIDIEAVKAVVGSSIMLKQPRFNSLLVFDSHGREHWRRVKINIDDHLIIRHEPLTVDPSVSEEDTINDYVADLSVSTPLSTDKPLWEFHLLMAHKCCVMRLHHALGDGISLMSMLLTCCRKASDPTQLPTICNSGGVSSSGSLHQKKKRRLTLGGMLKVLWYTLVFVLEFIMRSLWLKDKKSAMSGGAGVELWPRKLATARFSLNDMKTVKKALPNSTINDVLLGIISSGFSRYLDIQSPTVIMKEGIQITGVAMFNLRHQNGPQDFSNFTNDDKGTRFGNRFGFLLIPVYYHKSGGADPLQYVERAKAMIDKKKLSLEAPFSYKTGSMAMAFFGSKVAALLNYRILCNTTFTISNMIGPQEDITLTGNPVTYMKVNTTSLPHAVSMHMLSYNGRAEMQILVAKDIIPDPKLLAKCFEDSLIDMKEAAVTTAAKTNGDM